MLDPNFIILYVDSPTASAAFYADLFAWKPVEQSPTFALFAFASGGKLGLWQRQGVVPTPAAAAGGSELAFQVADAAAVHACHDDWRRRGLKIVQAPVELDFGLSFVALDPDGHPLRVFAMAAP
jgi:predicted enzyme related to lactoylglutathione lyase